MEGLGAGRPGSGTASEVPTLPSRAPQAGCVRPAVPPPDPPALRGCCPPRAPLPPSTTAQQGHVYGALLLSQEPPCGRGPLIRKVPGCLGHFVSAAELQLPSDLPGRCPTQAPGLREKQAPESHSPAGTDPVTLSRWLARPPSASVSSPVKGTNSVHPGRWQGHRRRARRAAGRAGTAQRPAGAHGVGVFQAASRPVRLRARPPAADAGFLPSRHGAFPACTQRVLLPRSPKSPASGILCRLRADSGVPGRVPSTAPANEPVSGHRGCTWPPEKGQSREASGWFLASRVLAVWSQQPLGWPAPPPRSLHHCDVYSYPPPRREGRREVGESAQRP